MPARKTLSLSLNGLFNHDLIKFNGHKVCLTIHLHAKKNFGKKEA